MSKLTHPVHVETRHNALLGAAEIRFYAAEGDDAEALRLYAAKHMIALLPDTEYQYWRGWIDENPPFYSVRCIFK